MTVVDYIEVTSLSTSHTQHVALHSFTLLAALAPAYLLEA